MWLSKFSIFGLVRLSILIAPANAQLQTLYHSAHGPRTGTTAQDTTFPFLGDLQGGQDGRPAEEVVSLLTRELENLILETQLRADGGPLKSAVDNAVERERRRRAAAESYATSPVSESWLKRRIGGFAGRISMNGYGGVMANGNGNELGLGNGGSVDRSYDGSPVRGERTRPGYVRARSRSLG